MSVKDWLKEKEKRVVIPTKIAESTLTIARDCAKSQGVTLRNFVEAAILSAKENLLPSTKDFSLQNKKRDIK